MKNTELIIARHAAEILGTALRLIEDRNDNTLRDTYNDLTTAAEIIASTLKNMPRE